MRQGRRLGRRLIAGNDGRDDSRVILGGLIPGEQLTGRIRRPQQGSDVPLNLNGGGGEAPRLRGHGDSDMEAAVGPAPVQRSACGAEGLRQVPQSQLIGFVGTGGRQPRGRGRDSAGQIAFWDLATAAEACLALGRGTEALEWIVRYVNSPDVDAFDLETILRHLTELWQLDPGSEPGASLLPILKSQLLRRAGGQGSLSAQEIVSRPAKNLEKVLGNSEGTLTLQWYRTGLERSRAVARIETHDGQAVGSGFLLRGKDVHPSLGNKLLLVTCAHVLSDDPNLKSALRSQEARVTFEALGADSPHEIAEILWTSPPDRLDTTVALLAPPVAGTSFCPIAARLPAQDSPARVYIIGHPGGRTLSISLSDNLLLDWEPPWIHYRAPTEAGSAGSPVFNSDWKLIGIHHAGGTNMRKLNDKEGTYAANEGIWIQSILRQVAQDLPGRRTPAPKRRREPSNP